MWGKNKSKSTKIETLIGTAMEIQGDLIFSGGLHVDGRIIGNDRRRAFAVDAGAQ